jgi:hypothetical protein
VKGEMTGLVANTTGRSNDREDLKSDEKLVTP